MDPNAKYGNTSPVANCAKAYGGDVTLAMHYVDNVIHGVRSDFHEDRVQEFLEKSATIPDFHRYRGELQDIAHRTF